LYLNGRDERI